MSASATMRVFISLTIRKRNGQPKIMAPAEMVAANGHRRRPACASYHRQSMEWKAHARQWRHDNDSHIAQAEGLCDSCLGRTPKLVYLAPVVVERILIARVPPVVSIKDLATMAKMHWSQHETQTCGV